MIATAKRTASPLAINGGQPVRQTPMPARRALGPAERAQMERALAWYDERDEDPGYQGHFETAYCNAFARFMGGGYADAVATGTLSLYVALAALKLPPGSEVLVSPITDPGTLSAITLQGLKPKLLDSMPGSFNTGLEEVKARLDQNTHCVLLVHAAGQAAPVDQIATFCQAQGVKLLEDCSQAHGARCNGKLVGTFGDISAFSTMYRKASITGSTGGVVYTQDETLYHQALAHADRGKPRWQAGFDDRDPHSFLFPALNLHANELGCAIGLASLARLPDTIKKRQAFLQAVSSELLKHSKVCQPMGCHTDDSPFYYPIFVDTKLLRCTKVEFAMAVRAEGIGLNPHYQYVVESWPWLKPYLVDHFSCVNAHAARDSAFCLYVNERYGPQEVEDTVKAILKVENHFCISEDYLC